jgi:PAS domain S-box-containing protein
MMAGKSYRTLLVAHGVLWSMLPLLVLGLATLAVTTSFLENEIAERNRLAAEHLASQTSQWMEPGEEILARAAALAEEAKSRPGTDLAASLDLLLSSGAPFSTLQIQDGAGNILCKAPPGAPETSGETPAGAWTDRNSARVFSFAFKEGGWPGPGMARPFSGGVVVGLLDLERPRVLLARFAKPGPDTASGGKGAFLLDARGNVVAQAREEGAGAPWTRDDLKTLFTNAPARGVFTARLGGAPVLAALAPVPAAGWSVVVAMPASTAMAPVQKLQGLFAMGVPATLVSALAVSVWLTGRLTRPFKALSGYATRLAMGDYDARLAPPAYTELNILARDLEAMAEAIRLRENALRDSEERYRTILDGIEDAYYETDLSGNLTFFNDSLCDIFGYSGRELLGMNNREYTDRENARRTFEAFNRVYRTGRPATGVERRIVTKAGQKRDIELSISLIVENGKKTGFRGIVREVTERRAMEAELKKTKSFLQNIMESSKDAIVSTDLAGNIEFATPSIQDLLGYTPKEMRSNKVGHYYSKGREDAVFIMRALKRSGGLTNHEMQLRKKDGSLMDVNLSASFLRNERGETIGTLGVLRDVTYAKRLEAHLQHAQKMEAIGTLAGGVAHDFNNLLMGIQGYVSLMLMDLDPKDPQHDRAKKIGQQVKSGAALTRQLLGVARGGKYEIKPKDPNELVAATAEMFGRTRKEIHIETRYGKDLTTVDVDRGQMEQVLLNLFVNAWQAMPGGGVLLIETSNVELDEEYTRPFGVAPGLFAKIAVTDTGCGMDQETCARVFDPFFTTKEKSRGTGLGLASAYGIMKNHNGIITVKSEPGKGSTFTLYIPASRSRAVPAETRAPEARKGRETVLMVDDEKMVLEVSAQMLKALGYKTLTARSGPEAVEVFKARGDEIDLVILDMIMPGMSGEETYSRLRRIRADVKVLLCSGYSIRGQASEILSKGCNGFVQKPFDVPILSAALREVLDKGE